MSEPDPKDVLRVEILLEPSGGEPYEGAGYIGVEIGVKFPDKPLMWCDADDGFITYEDELERGNAFIFVGVDVALDKAKQYILKQLREEGGWM